MHDAHGHAQRVGLSIPTPAVHVPCWLPTCVLIHTNTQMSRRLHKRHVAALHRNVQWREAVVERARIGERACKGPALGRGWGWARSHGMKLGLGPQG